MSLRILFRTTRHWLALPSPVEWLLLGAGLMLVARYEWYFDDAFIYFRYVDHLLFLDSGLTYNRGEFVEGFTSPGFCLLLIPLRALHLSYSTIVLGLGLACYAAFWAMLVAFNAKLSGQEYRGAAWNLPLAFLATNYAVASFFTSGLETPLVQVAAVACGLHLIRPRARWTALLVAMAPMARPELMLAVGMIGLFTWWRTGRFPRFLAVATAAINGSWLLFRIYYYADLLPNTFYLKEGTRFALGWTYLRDVIEPYRIVPVGIGLLAAFLYLKRRGTNGALASYDSARAAMLAIAAALTLYVVKVGGAAMHYYYLAFPFVLATCAGAGLVERVVAPFRWKRAAAPAVLGIAALSLFSYPTGLGKHPVALTEPLEESAPGGDITDPSFHRRKDILRPESWEARVTIPELRAFAEELASTGYRSTTTSGWCVHVWAAFRARSVHRFGLTDGILSRVEMPERKRGHKPGLWPLAKEMVRLQSRAERLGRGIYREAVEAGRAPPWIAGNLPSIELIERKIYNDHDFLENLGLALRFPARIDPGEGGA